MLMKFNYVTLSMNFEKICGKTLVENCMVTKCDKILSKKSCQCKKGKDIPVIGHGGP
jgi:hypothetical protein